MAKCPTVGTRLMECTDFPHKQEAHRARPHLAQPALVAISYRLWISFFGRLSRSSGTTLVRLPGPQVALPALPIKVVETLRLFLLSSPRISNLLWMELLPGLLTTSCHFHSEAVGNAPRPKFGLLSTVGQADLARCGLVMTFPYKPS